MALHPSFSPFRVTYIQIHVRVMHVETLPYIFINYIYGYTQYAQSHTHACTHVRAKNPPPRPPPAPHCCEPPQDPTPIPHPVLAHLTSLMRVRVHSHKRRTCMHARTHIGPLNLPSWWSYSTHGYWHKLKKIQH